MNRRSFLALAGAGTAALAGCAGDGGSSGDGGSGGGSGGSGGDGTAGSLPDGIYVQRYRESMAMQGTAEGGPYRVAFMYAAPHVFWQISGSETTETPRSGAIHGMAVPWHPDTGQVVPETGLTLEIARDGELVSQEVIYPMLSQPMGFHYGANFALPGEGTYTAELSVGAMSTRRTGAFRERFTDPVSASVEFEFSHSKMNEISWETLEEKAGTEGAVDAMQMGTMPNSLAPAPDDLPGSVVGETTAGDARFVLTVLDRPPAGVDSSGQYLALSARTPYNRMILPAMGAEATLTRDGETVAEGPLARTLDPNLNYHYGLTADAVESGDVLSVSVTTPPQVARHEGYETAFLEMDSFEFTV